MEQTASLVSCPNKRPFYGPIMLVLCSRLWRLLIMTSEPGNGEAPSRLLDVSMCERVNVQRTASPEHSASQGAGCLAHVALDSAMKLDMNLSTVDLSTVDLSTVDLNMKGTMLDDGSYCRFGAC